MVLSIKSSVRIWSALLIPRRLLARSFKSTWALSLLEGCSPSMFTLAGLVIQALHCKRPTKSPQRVGPVSQSNSRSLAPRPSSCVQRCKFMALGPRATGKGRRIVWQWRRSASTLWERISRLAQSSLKTRGLKSTIGILRYLYKNVISLPSARQNAHHFQSDKKFIQTVSSSCWCWSG